MSDGAERGTSERPNERSNAANGNEAASPHHHVPENPSDPVSDSPAFFVIRGEASDEEVAALVAVLGGLAGSATPPAKRRRPEWSAPHRLVRTPQAAGAGRWRSSALPT